jgi:hypothetical protein
VETGLLDKVIDFMLLINETVTTHRGFKKWACLLKFKDNEPG